MLWRRRRTPEDFAAEVQSHVELETDRLVAEGLAPDDARAAAQRRFGNATAVRERFYESSRLVWLDQAAIDLRSAVRSVARYPVAALVAVVSLGGGIGAATATLTMRDVLFYNPPPLYVAPQDLSAVRVNTPDHPRSPVTAPLYRLWSEDPSRHEAMAAAAPVVPADVRLDDRTETVGVRAVTANLFPVLGVAPALGRGFTAADNGAEGPLPAVLSDRVWRTLFGARTDVLGTSIWINGRAHTVIGVMPGRFWFAAMSEPVWTLAGFDALAPEAPLDVVIRRDAATSPQALQIALQAVADRFAASLPAGERRLRVQVRAMAGAPFAENMGPVPVFLIAAAVLFTVLIACTNVAILMIAQWTAREREMAIRASIGASRLRLVRTLVTESTLIAFAGGALGVCATYAIRGVILRNGGEFTSFDLSIHPGVLLSVALITALAGLLTGLLPALHETSRGQVNPLGRLGVADRVRQRWRHVLVAFEVAVTVALLVVVGTLVSATQRAMSGELGFAAAPLLVVRVQNPQGVDVAGLVNHLAGVAGVRSVAASTAVPLGVTGPDRLVAVDAAGSNALRAERARIGPGFFATLGVPLGAGRDFAAGEPTADSHVVVVSQVLASRLWPGAGAVGRTMWTDGQAYEVIGVVAAYANRSLEPARPAFYLPLGTDAATEMQFLVSAHGSPGPLVPSVRREIAGLAVGNVVSHVVTLDQAIQVGGKEILATAVPLAPLILIAMLLTSAGIYGVLAFSVARRSSEMAVRLAIGANRIDLVRLVAAHSLRVLSVGLAGGVGATFALTRLAQGSGGVFDSPGWQAFAVPALIVLVVGALATWLPARRAMRINPVQLLRSS